MSRERFNFNLLERLTEKYEVDARRCLKSRAYFGGLVCVRAALETMLLARFLLELFEWCEHELKQYGITVDEEGGVIEGVERIRLSELVKEAHKQGLLNKSGFEAAERIRAWGNKIHCARVAGGNRLPALSGRNLDARLDDLAVVARQLLDKL